MGNYSKNNPAKFRAEAIRNDGAIVFLKICHHNKNKKHKMSIDMGSVPDPAIFHTNMSLTFSARQRLNPIM